MFSLVSFFVIFIYVHYHEPLQEVAAGKRINLLGFGTFKLTARAARKGRNPQTGEELQIKASNSPSFTASKVFKERVNPDR